MSMQLHHLHTDGPKPLYKKITADEYERMTARIAELERMDTEHTLQIAKMNEYIHHLEEERRWRSVSEELPKLEEGCGEIFLVAVEAESNTNPKGGYVTNAEFCDGEWYNDETGNEIEENIEYIDGFYRSKVTHWMPLPSAPKEEK